MEHYGSIRTGAGVAERDRTLLEINNAIITKLTQAELFDAICQALGRAIPFDRVALVVHESENDVLRIAALAGPHQSNHFVVGLALEDSSHSRWVFDRQIPLLRHDLEIEQQPGTETRYYEEGIRSICTLPLVAGGRSIGAIGLGSKTRGTYSEADVPFLQQVARQVALAIGNMKAYEAIAALNIQVAHSERRWRAVYENSAVGVALTDLRGHFLAANRAYQKMLGYSEEELRSLTFLELTNEDDRETNWASVTELIDGKRTQFQLEKRYRRKDGSLIWVRNYASIVPSVAGIPAFLMTISEDIGERKRAQEALQKSEERSRTLLEINNAIITSLTQESLLQSVSEVVRRVIPSDGCVFTLYQPARETFRYLSVVSDFGSDFFRPGTEFDPKDSVTAWVFQHRRAVIRSDLEKQHKYSNDRRLLAKGIRSDCVVPMLARGKAIGTLNVGSKKVNQYSDQDAEFLQEVATQVALAVENMQAYEEINALKTRVEAENVYLQEEILRQHNFHEIVGNSPALLDVLRRVEIVAPTEATVLLYGETGTGKELLARAIHSRSPRHGRAMVAVNCGAIPSGLVESELFGHVKGAFTGALQNAIGRFELADSSTLFLDEVGELPADTQIKLLRVLQEHEFQAVGSSRTKQVDVRIIAATNRNLEEDVRSGRFRSDLFYRLNVVPLRVPALRERVTDIPELVLFFLQRYSQKLGKKIDSVSQDTLKHLAAYQWPGNIRELQNVIERGVVLSRGSVLSLDHDLLPVLDAPNPAADYVGKADSGSAARAMTPVQPTNLHSLEEIERAHILRVLESTNWIIDGSKGAAHVLRLHHSTLRARMKKLHIERPRH
jgi:formate hydrogenlyase transcriptional activator